MDMISIRTGSVTMRGPGADHDQEPVCLALPDHLIMYRLGRAGHWIMGHGALGLGHDH